MSVPPGVSERDFERAIARFRSVVGAEWVFTSDEDVALYRDAYSPLVGERPFRRPANSGTLFAAYTTGPVDVALSGYFVGKRDDSTFLSDGFFGNSMLLPNQDLDPAYQKIDLSASYRLHPRFRVYTTVDNLLNQDYSASFGFPSLPATIRVGASVGLGGD